MLEQKSGTALEDNNKEDREAKAVAMLPLTACTGKSCSEQLSCAFCFPVRDNCSEQKHQVV